MSLNESKAKTTRKSSRKTNPAVADTELAAVLAATVAQSVPLSRLVSSPLNVRTATHSASGIRQLADSIKGIGMLQNLVVHALPGGNYGVAAGGRRWAALALLAEDGSITSDWPVAVKVVPDHLAVAASLTENGARLDMHPSEQIAGFHAMAQEGKTPAQIADLLGYSARHVQRMLRLAGLPTTIIDALANDEITTEHCQALALESDPDRQMAVYEAASQQSWNGKPDVRVIKSLIVASEVSTDSEKFRFVGADAFSEGGIREDLFSDEQGGYVDALTLDGLVQEKLAVIAEGLRVAEGWAWCEGRTEAVRRYDDGDALLYRLQDAPKPVFTDEQRERLDALRVQYEAFDTECDESAMLEAEMDAIECAAALRGWTNETREGSGVVVSWQRKGVHVQRGVVLRESESADGEAADGTLNAPVSLREADPADEISQTLLTKISSERTLAVQAALMHQPEKSLALLTWTLCANVFGSGSYEKPARIALECKHFSLINDAPSGKDGAAITAMTEEKARLEKLLPPGWERDFSVFFSLDGNVLISLLSFCTACSLDGVQTRQCGHTSRSPLDGLEKAIGSHLRDWWDPTKDGYFMHLKKPQIVAALKEAGLPDTASSAEKMKKGDAAQLAETAAVPTRWIPGWLRPAGVPESATSETDTVHHDIAA